jgi:hypothetical protein
MKNLLAQLQPRKDLLAPLAAEEASRNYMFQVGVDVAGPENFRYNTV